MRYITARDHTPDSGLRAQADHTWQHHGRCYGLDPDTADKLFFPTARAHVRIAEAKALCERCDVRRICLDAALETGSIFGIWGGLTEEERKELHENVHERTDRARVHAVFNGRDVHLSRAERKELARLAHTTGMRVDRLASLLRVSREWAVDLLREARKEIAERDEQWEREKEKAAQKQQAWGEAA